ncbi:olfactory receptor 1009-like [Mauremys mutica]|uniref:olfactory receptor 1009-like n=1 Tax=Mauremys mutica TaxID=74926 RepID=UPI001D1678AF|nr:olfactory receptor 1009-like [Mauremys mutica]
MAKDNQTTVTDFILLGLSDDPWLQPFLFLVFLVIYLITFAGNMVIMGVIKAEPQLHTPMYFFLSHLSFVDICYSSVTVPKMLENFLAEQKKISFNGCVTQIFFFTLFVGVEIFTLSVMAYDRYTAICDPLHYLDIMNKHICVQVVLSTWALGFLLALINTVPVLNLHFCGSNAISHFSCELPPLLQLSCTDATINKVVLFATLMVFGLSSFLLTLVSYIHIISTVLKIRSVVGRHKVFSTCSSHLIVVGLLYLTGFFLYMKPNTDSASMPDRLISIQYSILTPMLNPIIYSLKNKEVKTALRKMLRKFKFLK